MKLEVMGEKRVKAEPFFKKRRQKHYADFYNNPFWPTDKVSSHTCFINKPIPKCTAMYKCILLMPSTEQL